MCSGNHGSNDKTAEHGIFGYSAAPNEYYTAVCGWFHDRFDWNFSPESIFIGSSGTHALIVDCIKSFTQPGDGEMFDQINGKQYRRICLTSPMSQVKEAFDRLTAQFVNC